MITALPNVYTVAEAAEKTTFSVSTLRREIRAGRLQVRRVGRCIRILDEELARWLREEAKAS